MRHTDGKDDVVDGYRLVMSVVKRGAQMHLSHGMWPLSATALVATGLAGGSMAAGEEEASRSSHR